MNLGVAIIDDEKDVRSLCKNVLKQLDFDLFTFASGRDFLEYEEKNSINHMVLVVDIMMPDINGIEMLKILTEKRALAMTPVIIFSGCHDDKIIESFQSIECLALDYLSKPFHINWLLAKVNNLAHIVISHEKMAALSVELLDAYSCLSNINQELNHLMADSPSSNNDLKKRIKRLIQLNSKIMQDPSNSQQPFLQLKNSLKNLVIEKKYSLAILKLYFESLFEQEKKNDGIPLIYPEMVKMLHALINDLQKITLLLKQTNIMTEEIEKSYSIEENPFYQLIKKCCSKEEINRQIFDQINRS